MPGKLVYKKNQRDEYGPQFLPPDAPMNNPIFKGSHNTFDIEHDLPDATTRQMMAKEITLDDLVKRYPPPGKVSGTWEKENARKDRV